MWHCVHFTANGASFGILFAEVRRRTGAPPHRLALGLALAENFALLGGLAEEG